MNHKYSAHLSSFMFFYFDFIDLKQILIKFHCICPHTNCIYKFILNRFWKLYRQLLKFTTFLHVDLPVSLKLLIVNESRSTDFGLSGDCSESNFGFDTVSVSNFDEMEGTSPLILKWENQTKEKITCMWNMTIL